MLKKIKESDFIYWGLLLAIGAPVLVFGIFIILSFIMFGMGFSPEEFYLLLIVKAVCFGGGILLIICGSYYKKNFFSAVLGIIAISTLFIQLMPVQVSPTGLDIALDLPGLALVFIALAVWLPEVRKSKLTVFILLVCAVTFAYQLFVILAVKFIPYALPSFLQTYSWLKILGNWITWLVYFSLLLRLITSKTDTNISFRDYGYFFKYFLGTVTAAFLIAIILITCIFVQLEEGTAVIEYTLYCEDEAEKVDILLPIPFTENQEPLIHEKGFKIYDENNKLLMNVDMNIENTDYDKMLHLFINDVESSYIILRGELASKRLGWHLGKEEVPTVLNPRISEDEGVNIELPVMPEHHNSLYTAVHLKEGISNLNYCFELIVRGIKFNIYQQVFSSYLPLNYAKGYELEQGWNMIPMIEEIFVR